MSRYQGGCLCGIIRYEVDKIEDQMGHCYCSMCRKFHGAAFATFGEVLSLNFRWTSGEEHLKSYRADNGTLRQFCETCGSSLIFKAADDNGSLVQFSLGTLDTDLDHKPDAQLFVGSKANWVKITDDLPQYDEDRVYSKVEINKYIPPSF